MHFKVRFKLIAVRPARFPAFTPHSLSIQLQVPDSMSELRVVSCITSLFPTTNTTNTCNERTQTAMHKITTGRNTVQQLSHTLRATTKTQVQVASSSRLIHSVSSAIHNGRKTTHRPQIPHRAIELRRGLATLACMWHSLRIAITTLNIVSKTKHMQLLWNGPTSIRF